MSLCIYARIIPMCMVEDMLNKIIVDYFAPNNDIVQQVDKESISYEKINDENNIIITLVKERKPPYNIYDSEIINDEFEYVQLIIFDILKDTCSVEDYKNIIKFCIYLQTKINCEILITSDAHNELCLLQGDKVLWSKEKEEIFCLWD